VPKYTVYIGAAYGAGYMAMAARPFEPTATFFWPNGRADLMGPDQAANTLWDVRVAGLKRQGKSWSVEDERQFKEPMLTDFNAFANAYNFAANLWTDGVIDPVETRDVLALLLDVAGRTPPVETRYGIFRH
jgi:3-methylcrotonyl-CoA carboxylase beta subunit